MSIRTKFQMVPQRARLASALVVAVAAVAAPALFAEDAYIQTSTHSFMDTGYFHNCNTRVELDCALDNPIIETRDQYLFGTHGSSLDGQFFFGIYIKKATAHLGWNCQTNKSNYSESTSTIIDNSRHTFVLDAYRKQIAVLNADGSSLYSYNFTHKSDNGRSLYSFVIGTTRGVDGVNGNCNAMKIYGVKIYESGTLVRDYSPATKGGIVGLYDSIDHGFISAIPHDGAGSAEFTSGGELPEIPDDPCIISDGTPKTGINTGVRYGPDSRIELDYAFTTTNRYQMRIIGRDYSSPRIAFYIQGTGKVAFGFDKADHSAFAAATTDIYADTLRHTIFIDQPGGKAYFVTGGVTNKTVTIPSAVDTEATIPIALFGNTANNGLTMTFGEGTAPAYNSAIARIYGAKFWKGDTLVRDLVPLVRGGIPGFLDRVSGAFLTAENNEQLAAFSASPATTAVADDPFVALPGNNSTVGGKLCFDTGYVPNNTTRVELDFAQYAVYPSDGYSGNHNWYLFYADATFNMYYNKSGMGWSAGNSWKGFTPNVNTARTQDKDVRRTAILDMQNLSAPASLVTAGYTNCVSSSAGTSISITTPLYIAANTAANSTGALKIYGCKIFENGSLIHSFEPRIQNGLAGLLDTVGDKGFITGFTDSTAANITPGGSLASNDAYIASSTTDTFSIQTGYMIGPNTRIDADFSFLARSVDVYPVSYSAGNVPQQFVYEAGTTDTIVGRIYLNGTAGTGAIAWSHNKPYNWTGSDQTMVPGVRYTMSIAGNGTKATATLNVNGVQKYTASTNLVGATTTAKALRLFSSAAGTGNWAMMKLYSFRISEYENGQYVLKREFLPYTNGERTGLIDTVEGGVYWNTVSGSPDFTMTGKGVDGKEKWVKELPAAATVQLYGSTTLTAAAAGAKSYVWKKNGVVIAGETGESIAVPWDRKGYKAPATYSCTAVYDVFGVETLGEPVSTTVTHVPSGIMLIIL